MMQGTHTLTPDTQAVLLLCGRFGKKSSKNGAKPLTNTEYARLAAWMFERGMRPADLLEESGWEDPPVEAARLSALLKRSAALAMSVEGWAGKGLWVMSRGDEAYPARLKSLKHLAPPILNGAGNASLLSDGGMAVVGSRDADDEALDFTERVARACAEQSMQIVSGGARGVDSAAMLAAVEAGGNVVGVLADSLGRAAVSGKYRDALEEGRLALVSPYDPASGFNVGHAMQRNDHIYALADRSLVVNASVGKGGTWAGATSALKKGREVFVRIRGNAPEGNHELVMLGATPFPKEPWNALREKLSRIPSHTTPTEPESAPREPEPDYGAILPRLMDCLSEPRKSKEVAEMLDTRPRQTQSWLKRAVEEGKVEKRNKPVRYVRAENMNLFSSLEETDE